MLRIKLYEARIEKNMSLRELAEKSGVSKSHINAIESGRKKPGIEVLYLLSKALDVSINDLIEIED